MMKRIMKHEVGDKDDDVTIILIMGEIYILHLVKLNLKFMVDEKIQD